MKKSNNNNWILYFVCVAVAVVGGLFGWKWYKGRKAAKSGGTAFPTPSDDTTTAGAETIATKAIGYRINNPLNIRYSAANNWKGQTGQQSGFCVFDTPENGIRAAMVNLKSYRKKGVVTIGDIISRWAPPTENNTQNYIDFVCRKLGADASAEIEQNAASYIALLQAMCIMEIGAQPYTESVWTVAAVSANL